jgi:hypothetical protein
MTDEVFAITYLKMSEPGDDHRIAKYDEVLERSIKAMAWKEMGKGLVYGIVSSAMKWFPDETARYNFYLDLIVEVEKESKELCNPEARKVDPVFDRALLKLYPDLVDNEGMYGRSRESSTEVHQQ